MYVVVVGIDGYRAWPRLQRAVGDARGVRDAFVRLGFREFRPPLFDEAATGAALRRLVTDELCTLGDEDSLVVFFAGHGYTVLTPYSDGTIAKRGYLVPIDAGPRGTSVGALVSLDIWLRDLAYIPAKHILVILDACHSGIALNPVIQWRGEDVRTAEPLAKLRARRSRRIIASALDNELAMDGGPMEGHSLFTGCLIEALTGGLKARTGWPTTTGSELALYVRRRVASFPGSRQTPDFGALDLDDRGELIIELSELQADERREVDTIERSERMMKRLIPASPATSGATKEDPRWAGEVAELPALREPPEEVAEATRPVDDHRLEAFLQPTDVFAGVQQPVSVFEADPIDVQEIHRNARIAFEQLMERAVSLSQHASRNRMLLLLGDSGSGKTHLLRSFRRHVEERGRGLVAYAQMYSAAKDYTRYLLYHVVDSLSRPYQGTASAQTGLTALAIGLANLVAEPTRSEILQLSEGDWDADEGLRHLVNRLVDELHRVPALGTFHADLLRVLLYALAPDERTAVHAYQYLRCEDMNAHDRSWIGDVPPRTSPEHPRDMIRDLARLAFLSRKAALVLLIDQAELSVREGVSDIDKMFIRAVDALHDIVGEEPTVIAVVACLSDVYTLVRRSLSGAMLDRLEKDPPYERLHTGYSYPEIEAIVSRRLSWLYARAGATYRPDQPVYPIPVAALHSLANRRARDVLQWCDQYQRRCVAAKALIEPNEPWSRNSPDADLEQIASAWNDACHAPAIEVPDNPEAILLVVAVAAEACAEELGLSLATCSIKNQLLRVHFDGPAEQREFVIAVTNQGYQRGAFVAQLEALRRVAVGATPIAVRTLKFPQGRACDEAVGKLLKVGGRRAYVDASALRALAVSQKFRPAFPKARVAAWRRRDRPISTLPSMIELFDLE
jgi:hypothetical protein